MAQIPILKLNNGKTNYYPFSVGESLVTTHPIEVKHNVGGYVAGDTIDAVTSLDQILTKLFSNADSNIPPATPGGTVTAADVDVDGVTIIKDSDGKLKIGEIGQDKVVGLNDVITGLRNESSGHTEEVETLRKNVNQQINDIKFSDDETFNISRIVDIANILKDILLRLGALEQNITIDEFAKSTEDSDRIVTSKKLKRK